MPGMVQVKYLTIYFHFIYEYFPLAKFSINRILFSCHDILESIVSQSYFYEVLVKYELIY